MSTADDLSRPHAPRRAFLALIGLVAALVVVPLGPAQAVVGATPTAVPVTPVLGEAVDGEIAYEGQKVCSPTVKPGAKKLAALLTATYGPYTIGITRACTVGDTSEHKEGRALDWMVSAKIAAQKAKAEAFLAWLTATDGQGNVAAMARRLGVMYIGWNNTIWRAYDPARGWAELKGCLTDPAKAGSGYDTYCHRNHVHISLTWDGAAGLSSWWSGVALPASCSAGWGAGASVAGASGDLVPVVPVRVADTRDPASACRLQAPGYTTTKTDLVATVTGKGDVPATGVGAVAVRVTATRTSAPTPTISVRSSTSSAWTPAVMTLGAGTYSSTLVVPVASDGTIRLGIDRGAGDVSVDVVAWAPLLVTPTPTGPATADGTTASTAVVYPQTAYNALTTPLKPREIRTINLAGVAGIPAQPASLALTLVTGKTTAASAVSVFAALPGRAVGYVVSSTLVARATQVVVPSPDGTLVLYNSSRTASVPVQLRLQGWSSTAVASAGRTTLLASPVTVVDTIAKVGLSGPFVSSVARTLTLPPTAVPAGSTAVLLSVSVLGGTSAATLSLRSRGGVVGPSMSPGVWTHEVVLVPLSATGVLGLVSTSYGSHVRARVLGYVS